MPIRSACLALLLLAACASAPDTPPKFVIQGPQATPAGPEIAAPVTTARARVEAFFGRPFTKPVRVAVSPTRSAFDASLPTKWSLTPTQCWMVGVGADSLLALLSPAAWPTEACEHNGKDAAHIQEIITHELTHVYHGQHNPTGDFAGMDDAGWFVEGLAVVVSGQLDDPKRASAAEAIASGAAPAALADAWSGKFRYGVSGSMVAFIDTSHGRSMTLSLLGAVDNTQILDRLGVSEAEFLAGWRAWVISTAPKPASLP